MRILLHIIKNRKNIWSFFLLDDRMTAGRVLLYEKSEEKKESRIFYVSPLLCNRIQFIIANSIHSVVVVLKSAQRLQIFECRNCLEWNITARPLRSKEIGDL